MCSAQCGKSSLLIKMKAPRLLTLLCHLTLSLGALNAQHWQVRDLLEKNRGELQVTGNPLVRDDGCRTAVFFDGKGDGIFMDAMPLTGLQQFTIEVVFKPLRGGNFEQRFFHCGEIGGDRVAFVVNQGELSTYVNGKKELATTIRFTPIQTGKSSLGVRLNHLSWFKGAIEQVRITSKALNADELLQTEITPIR